MVLQEHEIVPPEHPWPERDAARAALSSTLKKALFFGVAYFLAALVGKHLAGWSEVYVALWLPAGLYMAALLLSKRSEWRWLILAAFAANSLFDWSRGMGPATSLALFVADTLQAVAGAFLVQRFVKTKITFSTLKEFWTVIGITAFLAPILGSFIGALVLMSSGLSPSWLNASILWWQGNGLGILITLPLLVAWFASPGTELRWHRQWPGVIEFVLLLSGMLLSGYLAFRFEGGIRSPYKVLAIPFLLFAGLRFGRFGAACAAFLLSAEYIFLTHEFAHSLPPDEIASGEYIRVLHITLAVIPFIALLPAIVVHGQREALEKLRWRNRTYAVLSSINKLIVRERDPEALCSGACRIAVEQGGFRMAWIGFLDAAQNLKPIASAGVDDGYLDQLDINLRDPDGRSTPTGHVLLTGEHQVCNDFATDPRAKPWREAGLKRGYCSFASLPLKVKGKVIGAYLLYASEPNYFDDPEMRLLDELAGDIGFAIEVHEQELERVAAQNSLRESEERFRELAETVEDVFWINDLERRKVLYVSPAYEKIWGRTRQSLYDSPQGWLDAVHPDDRERVRQFVMIERTPKEYDLEYRIDRPDGETRWIRDRSFFVPNAAGRVERVVGIARDITDRRQLEEQFRQSQKMEAFGQLAGGVAHDINNLLSVMTMRSDLALMEEGLPADVRDGLQEIRMAAERAANLTRQLLLFSRRQVMQPRDVDLNEVVAEMAKMLRRTIGADVRLELRPHPTPLITHADAGMLDQVLLNLAVNARDAMPEGGQLIVATGEFTVDEELAQRQPDTTPGPYVSLTVTDTGSGIPPEIRSRIFEPFFTTKAEGKGTGLGLATVFGIVKQHRGWVRVESEVGKGTTFQIFFPASTAAAPDESLVHRAEPRGGTETILLVEDEDTLRLLSRLALERFGYRVFEAANGADAQQVWREHSSEIELLVTDLVMPGGVTGHELARQIRSERPDLRVIYTSGYSMEIAGRELELTSSEMFLQKPFQTDRFLETVRQSLDGKSPPGPQSAP
jgi:PAS domain S-box-containing protein